MTTIRAFAKVNLSLRVGPLDRTGKHRLRSLAQSIDLADTVTVERSDDDEFTVAPAVVEADQTNLAWRAVAAVRQGVRAPVRLSLQKQIPVAAGLGGGSADAAAGLVAAGGVFGATRARLEELAPALGSDVPFCLIGGRLWFEGYGEILTEERMSTDFALAVVVPMFELSTAAVYRRWDEMEGPTGPGVDGRHLPPSLREHGPLINDLTPAAIDLRPELGDWHAELAALWGRPVLLTGSGPATFAFFTDVDEAEEAAAAVRKVRSAFATQPVDRGWDGKPGGKLSPPPWAV